VDTTLHVQERERGSHMVTEVSRGVPNQRLKHEREKRGWSQRDLAKKIGSDHDTVSRWERGLTIPRPSTRDKLCKLFEISLQELGFTQEGGTGGDQPTCSLPSQPGLYDPAIPISQVGGKGLVGRTQLLTDLKRRLCSGMNVALSALNGLPGVGKTIIAVELARDREVLDYFRDGVLWAGLGIKPNIVGLLGRWGTLLGLASHEMAELTSVEAWAKTINAVIGTRRMLLVIDDAWSIEDALAFQVGGVHCAHIVTTRFPEIALQFAYDGSNVVHELNEEDGIALLERLAPQVVAQEPGNMRSLVRSVGGLPLAITLAGKYLWSQFYRDQPHYLSMALSRLQSIEERLRLTQPPPEGSPSSLPADTTLSLQTVINLSYQQLDTREQDALRALSLFPAKPGSFAEEAALAVCNTSVETLDRLIDAGLLEGSGPGCYTLHQTIADYALLRLTDALAGERMVAFFNAFIESNKTNYHMLEGEMDNVLAALQIAYEHKMSEALIRGVVTFAPYLEVRGLYSIAETHLKRARQVALATSDNAGLALTLLHLGRIAERRGNFWQAERYLQESLARAREMGHRWLISETLCELGDCYLNQFKVEAAYAAFDEAHSIARGIGGQELLAHALYGLAHIALFKKDVTEARRLGKESLAIFETERHEKVAEVKQWLAPL
jgi:transcriptional regulator with XRE-family HTH domain/tetratricopeptide (TPR) repeat protein